MKILVLIKSVPDTASLLRLDIGCKSVCTDELEYIINPYDEYALEEAMRLKESAGGEVIAISMGDEQSVKSLRHALSFGADSAIWVKPSVPSRITSCSAAKILALVIRGLGPDVIFAGKRAIDDDAAQIPERIAELLDLPHVSAITRFSLHDRAATVDRQTEDGHYTIETILPALFTAEKGLNVPRYPKLPDILRAKRKVIVEIVPDDSNLQTSGGPEPGIETLSLLLQSQKRAATILQGASADQVGLLLTSLKSGGVF